MMLLLLIFVALTAAFSVNVTVLDQSNAVERWPDLSQRLRIQNITDIAGQPLLTVADDAELPDTSYFQAHGVRNGLQDCQSLTIGFQGIRMRTYSNPVSLTVQFWRDDPTGAPQALFYQKTLPWPSNDDHWARDYMALPWPFEVTLRWGELGDDGHTRFDFRSPVFIAPLRRFWVALYCTSPRQATTGMRENALYWMTQSNRSNASALQPQLVGGVDTNQAFYFRDTGNLARVQAWNWTPAAVYQALLPGVAPTGQMAWRLWLTCQVPPAPTTGAPTEAPSAAPTTEAPHRTPVAERIEPVSSNRTGAPSLQGVISVTVSSQALALAIALPLSLVLLVLLLAMGVRWLRRRRAMQKASEVEHEQQRRRGMLQLRVPQLHAMPHYTDHYSPISLSDGGGDENEDL